MENTRNVFWIVFLVTVQFEGNGPWPRNPDNVKPPGRKYSVFAGNFNRPGVVENRVVALPMARSPSQSPSQLRTKRR